MIMALTNSKGGVGKSTLAVHLAVWCQEHGATVALVDADAQGSSSLWLQEASPTTPRFRLPTPDDILEQVPALRSEYDQLIIDGPAGLSEVTRAILLVTDFALLPCGPSALDLRAANDAIRVRIPMKADTCSNSYRTPFQSCRTVVGAKRRAAGVIMRCPTGVKVWSPFLRSLGAPLRGDDPVGQPTASSRRLFGRAVSGGNGLPNSSSRFRRSPRATDSLARPNRRAWD